MTSTLRFAFLSCVTFALLSAAHADDQLLQEALQDCDKNQMNMNLCAGHRYSEADKALNRQYRQTLAARPTNDDRKRLRDAQRAWLGFRDKDCLAQTGPRESSGSIWPLLHFDCLTQHSEQRTKELARQACGLEGCEK